MEEKKEKKYYYKVVLSDDNMEEIKKAHTKALMTSSLITREDLDYISSVFNKVIELAKLVEVSSGRSLGVRKAREIRSKQILEKIQNAINILKFENKLISIPDIVSVAGVSYPTVKKYIDSGKVVIW